MLTVVMLAASWWTAIRLGSPLELVWCSPGLACAVGLFASWAWIKSGAWRRLAY